MNPNSQHQLWSRWSFEILSPDRTKRPSTAEVRENARKFFAQGFHSTAGRLRVDRPRPNRYAVVVEIEGPPVHDPGYRADIKRRVVEHFIRRGFGPQALMTSWRASLLAGDAEDGRPPAQALFMPDLTLPSLN